MPSIVVVGSINMDIVNVVEAFPKPGETIRGKGTEYIPGGKGANQAVAAAKAGGSVAMAGAVGTDPFGNVLIDGLRHNGVITEHVLTKEGTSGIAFITVSGEGENTIVLSAGSNGRYDPGDMPADLLQTADMVLLQNEIPWETTCRVMNFCRQQGIPVLLNPAPARKLSEQVLPLIDTLVLNETEAEYITGQEVHDAEQAVKAAEQLITSGVRAVIVTLGAEGSVYADSQGSVCHTPAFRVQPVDTTGAGDTFIGAYASAVCSGAPLEEALRFATAAAALSVSRAGAQTSIPTKAEIERFLA